MYAGDYVGIVPSKDMFYLSCIDGTKLNSQN